jgi:hypothetical protein
MPAGLWVLSALAILLAGTSLFLYCLTLFLHVVYSRPLPSLSGTSFIGPVEQRKPADKQSPESYFKTVSDIDAYMTEQKEHLSQLGYSQEEIDSLSEQLKRASKIEV